MISVLKNKHILVGVTGGIAAYKTAELVRLLKGEGAQVRVVMTQAAMEFITPLTMQALSGYPVHTALLDEQAEAGMGHIELAKWADALIIAPATADFLARFAHGHADDLLSTICLATDCPIAIAPAMNQQMWAAPSTIENIHLLKQRHIHIWGPEAGEQACGDIGLGRMSEPANLLEEIQQLFQPGILTGREILLTAGPTREALDPIRFLSNHSSGKMGYALAQACYEAGGHVTLITGPVALAPPAGIVVKKVISALEMYQAVLDNLSGKDIFMSAAAVSDYRFQTEASSKIKKQASKMTVELIKNPDILLEVATNHPKLVCVGFAAETDNLLEHAKQKLVEKKLFMIVANQVGITGQGFDVDENAATVLMRDGRSFQFDLMSKAKLARELVKLIGSVGNSLDCGKKL